MFSRRASTVVVVLLVLLVTFALVASTLPSFAATTAALPAHARLVSTTPEDGAEVGTADRVGLTFSEDVDADFLEVRVEGPDGDEVDGAPEVDGRTVTQDLTADLPAGEHTVTYRVVSVDGHPVSGSFAFTTTQEPSPSPSASGSPSASASASPGPSASSAAPTPGPTPSTTTAAIEGTPGWLLPVLLVGLLVVLGAVGTVLVRRRGGGPPREGGGRP